MDEVKEQVVTEALQSKANLIIADTASNFTRTVLLVDRALAAGYTVSFGAVYADRDACETRGKQRLHKGYDAKNWEISVQSILDMHAHLQSRGALKNNSVQLYSSTGTLYGTTLERVRELLEWHRQKAQNLMQGKWCEICLLAGVYESSGGDSMFEIVPANLADEVVPVSVTVIRSGCLLETMQATFDASSCTLSAPDASWRWLLCLCPDGKACLKEQGDLRYGMLVQINTIYGKSLTFPISQDQALLEALGGLDFCRMNLRALSEEECRLAAEAAHLSGPSEAPSRSEPRALLVVAPSGSGKTSVGPSYAGHFDMKPEEMVIVDSKTFLDFHAQYCALLHNGIANQGIWFRSWPAAKQAISKAKDTMLDAATSKKNDVLVSETGANVEKMLKVIDKLKEQGYIVNLCGIFASAQEIIDRGVAREVRVGKRFNRDLRKLCKSFDAFAPAVKAINGRFCLVRNSQGKSPDIHLEGCGGTSISFNLDEALARNVQDEDRMALTTTEQVEEVEVFPEDVTFLMEGNMNVVASYHGDKAGWDGCALRCRKGDNSMLRVDQKFIEVVATCLFGKEYLDVGRLVGLTPANIKAIDEALLESRPAKRREKRLDSEVRDHCGRVLIRKVANLMAAPTTSAETSLAHKVITVEIKPKCGLLERRGLPSRYRLLQHHKLAKGKVSRISSYDPVKLLSKQQQLIHEALVAAIDEPQNNFRVFIDGKLVSNLDEDLQVAGVPGQDGLVRILSALLASPTTFLPERLKRVQALACGETAPIVNQLYCSLVAQHGTKLTHELLARTENFQLGLEGIDGFPCDEAGIDLATQQMDSVLSQVRSEKWSAALETEVIRSCCRFLLGKMAQDVSIIINFVHIPQDPKGKDIEARLLALRFKPVDFLDVADTSPRLFFRITIVDCDVKRSEKIPEYATQFDEYVSAYYKRSSLPTIPSSEALGGHEGGIIFEGDLLWKRDQGGRKGQAELAFLRWALDVPVARRFVPELIGFRTKDGERWIGMSNLLRDFKVPAVLDLKIGTRTWNTKASPEKAESQRAKAAASTTSSLGVRVVAGAIGRVADAGAGDEGTVMSRKSAKPVQDEHDLQKLLGKFLQSAELQASALAKVQEIADWWIRQQSWAFYGSSILLAYDAANVTECRAALIDFANAEEISSKAEDLSGHQVGLETLIRAISSLQPGANCEGQL